jgi:hypothetical protein
MTIDEVRDDVARILFYGSNPVENDWSKWRTLDYCQKYFNQADAIMEATGWALKHKSRYPTVEEALAARDAWWETVDDDTVSFKRRLDLYADYMRKFGSIYDALKSEGEKK